MLDLTPATAIQGWMSESELEWLASMASLSSRIIEVGCWKGRSTKALAMSTPGMVWAVDNWAGTVDNADGSYNEAESKSWQFIYDQFVKNLMPDIGAGKLVIVKADRLDAVWQFALPYEVDFLFIDGDHRYDAVACDIRYLRPLVKRGGVIAGHDYAEDTPGVIRAVDEQIPDRSLVPNTRIWWKKV